MFIDEKYTDNVVFQRNAVDQLLTNIKNYPITDIDYIEQTETDDSDRNIWNTYTDGTPCIKITYGDENTKKGNIIYAKVFQKAKELGKREANQLIEEIAGLRELEHKWNKVYEANLEVYEERYEQLNNFAVEKANLANGKAADIIDALHQLWQSYNLTFEDFFNNPEIQNYIINKNTPQQATRFEKLDISILSNEDNPPDPEIEVTFVSCVGESRTDIIAGLLAEIQSAAARQDQDISISEIESEIEEMEEPSEVPDQEEPIEPSSPSYEEFVEAIENLIVSVRSYPNYEKLTNGEFNITQEPNDIEPEQIYNYLKKFLTYVVNSAKLKMLNAKTVRDYYTSLLGDISDQIDRLNKMQEDSDTCINLIAEGTNDINTEANNIKVLQGDLPVSYTVDEDTFSVTSLEDWISKVALGLVEIDPELDLIEATGTTNRLLEGIKYVKVGSNIKFIDSLDGTTISPTTASYLEQDNGSFRVTINSDTYEVPIKGFENSTTANLVTSVSIIPDAGANGDINLGSEGDPFDNGYFNNLYANNGYFDQVTIGDVIIGGEGGTGDSGKFLRGDGQWSNELTNSLVITDDTDALRFTTVGGYASITASTLAQNNIAHMRQEGYFTVLVNNASINNGDTIETFNLLPPNQIPFNGRITIQRTITYLANSQTVTQTYATGILTPDDTSFLTTINSVNLSVNPTPTIISTKYYFNSGDAGTYYTLNNGTYTQCESGIGYTDTTFYYVDPTQTNDPATGLGENSALVQGSINTLGGIAARKSIKGYKLYSAVFNDYAECRATSMATPGYVVIDQDDGTMITSSKRLQPGAQVISDTYGHLLGEMPGVETPIAVAGRVLVYTYRPREEYHAGMAVCSAPGGTIDIMTREEIRDYPDCIIGIVSEIPQYDVWGSDSVKVNGRIWIKVR